MFLPPWKILPSPGKKSVDAHGTTAIDIPIKICHKYGHAIQVNISKWYYAIIELVLVSKDSNEQKMFFSRKIFWSAENEADS